MHILCGDWFFGADNLRTRSDRACPIVPTTCEPGPVVTVPSAVTITLAIASPSGPRFMLFFFRFSLYRTGVDFLFILSMGFGFAFFAGKAYGH